MDDLGVPLFLETSIWLQAMSDIFPSPRFRSSWCEDRCGWPSVRRVPNWNVNINGVSNPRGFTKATFTNPNNALFRKNPQNDHRCLSLIPKFEQFLNDPVSRILWIWPQFHCLQCFVGGSFCWVLGFSRRIKCRFVQTSVQISNLSASKLKKVTRHAFIQYVGSKLLSSYGRDKLINLRGFFRASWDFRFPKGGITTQNIGSGSTLAHVPPIKMILQWLFKTFCLDTWSSLALSTPQVSLYDQPKLHDNFLLRANPLQNTKYHRC